MGQILNIIKKIWDFIKKNKRILGFFFWIAGIIAGIFGKSNIDKAKNTDDEAKRIFDAAIKKYEDSEKETTEVLEKLGRLQMEVVETYPRLINAVEMIERRQKGLISGFKKSELSKHDIVELKEISNSLGASIKGAGGAGVGIALGVAVYGVNAAALGPGAFVGGVIICAQGAKLLESSSQNMRHALETQNKVEEIIKYHTELRYAAELLFQSMERLFDVYNEELPKLEKIALSMPVNKKKKFSADEGVTIKNVSRLAKLLNRMCKVELILKPKSENEIETVNMKEVTKLVNEGKAAIA